MGGHQRRGGAVIDAGKVTQWRRGRRAKGLVERAACERLRGLAGQVPSDEAIVELGAYRGRATGWLLLGASEGGGAHVTSVDPWGLRADAYSPWSPYYTDPAAEEAFIAHLSRIGAHPGVHTRVRGFAAAAGRTWPGPKVGLLWHDAEHTAGAVEEDLAAWAPHLAKDAVVVLHDAADPRHGVVEGAARVLGRGYERGWAYVGADGWVYADPQVIRWGRKPERRGLLIACRGAPAGGPGSAGASAG